MINGLVWSVKNGESVKLKEYDPGYTDGQMKREDAETMMVQLGKELGELQELLFAARQQSVLMVLQGMDTSGKDGTIRHVFSAINPQGCIVHAFKQPTEIELAHDFLWRVHAVTPGKGVIGIFNRSHYEDVLIARVHDLVPEKVWRGRYEEINHFERLLVDNGTILLKFFLYISYEEQTERLQARVQEKDKSWKISASDFAERKYWKVYQEAYEDALSKCNTDAAPWYIVPANHKWYRNLAIAHTLVHELRKYKDRWTAGLQERGRQELEMLRHIQEEQKAK
ncbi:MAG TPA: polyphosphate kinase 2 family protein [Dictyobacter sp.]|jgi:PPK2 family polyphosphate:nucleotide phosphotransferase|nr:polyphosphate kinase 2 family protein [Dictyobacter sp.]